MKYSTLHAILRQRGRAPQGTRGLKFVGNTMLKPARGRAPQGARGLKSYVLGVGGIVDVSRPARGAWVEIPPYLLHAPTYQSRPARGAWVEIAIFASFAAISWSRPARGAWVEISFTSVILSVPQCRAPQGARGLKSSRGLAGTLALVRRAPQGARGLKCDSVYAQYMWAIVAPRKGRVG